MIIKKVRATFVICCEWAVLLSRIGWGAVVFSHWKETEVDASAW